MSTSAEDLGAILAAYRLVKRASWPHLHPMMEERVARWPSAGEAELRAELDGYLTETGVPGCSVRVFWKLGPKFVFGGANERFAADAGLPLADLVGIDDFDPRLPWRAQAAKYRADDKEVFESGAAKLDILERQTSGAGTIIWVRVGKTAIRRAGGEVIGVLGMYELLNDESAKKIFLERSQAGPPTGPASR